MRFLIVGGHQGTTGATGHGIEEQKAKELSDIIVKYLKEQGHQAEEPDYNLFDKIKREGVGTDLRVYNYILEVHFNAFDGSAYGTEVCVYSKSSDLKVELAILGVLDDYFRNRGIKERPDLQNVKLLTLAGRKNSLVEIAFIDNSNDMKIYEANKEAIGKGIAHALITSLGGTIKSAQAVASQPVASPTVSPSLDKAQTWAVNAGIMRDRDWDKPMTRSQLAWILFDFMRKIIIPMLNKE